MAYKNILDKQLIHILNSLYDGIFITDRQGICVLVNKAYERISGYEAKNIIGQHVEDLVQAGIISQSVSIAVLKEKKSKSITQKLQTGKELLVTGNPVFDEQGEIHMVITNVRDVSELYQLKQELNQLQERFSLEMNINQLKKMKGHVYLKSKSMQYIYELIHRISNVDSNVLITGETGVGKEVIANLVHRTSKRKNAPFVKINCGAIPHDLLESELFGYTGGSFTGANKQGKIGLFETADKGTIMLDEIGELPKKLQVKLLRVVQQQEFVPVGSTKPKKIDTRIIAATNLDLEKEMEKGNFRQDLFYRLNVITIDIPPLRERREDIYFLSNYLLQKINKKYRLNKKLSPQLISSMERYRWPGNIRELENVIERLAVTTPDDILETKHINDIIKHEKIDNNIKPLKKAVEEVEINLIKQAMDSYKNTYKAAEALGVDQSTLVRKKQKYKI